MYQALLEIKEDLGEGQMQSSKGKPSIQKLLYVKIVHDSKKGINWLALLAFLWILGLVPSTSLQQGTVGWFKLNICNPSNWSWFSGLTSLCKTMSFKSSRWQWRRRRRWRWRSCPAWPTWPGWPTWTPCRTGFRKTSQAPCGKHDWKIEICIQLQWSAWYDIIVQGWIKLPWGL